MPRTWLTIRVELLSSIYGECEPAPGRVFLVGPRHTFEQLARAINVGFARWDFSHLNDFELADGTTIGFPDPDWERDDLDQATTKVLSMVSVGERFSYRFDFGDDWEHACTVDPETVDPLEVYGEAPKEPVPIFGWGWIPDQYGRIGDDDQAAPEPDGPYLHDEIERLLILGARVPMTSAQLAAAINKEGRYVKMDGSAVTASQISARVNKYPRYFARTEDGSITPLRPDA